MDYVLGLSPVSQFTKILILKLLFGIVIALYTGMKHFSRFYLLKLCILLTVVQSNSVFGSDTSHLNKYEVKVVKYQLWNQESSPQLNSLKIKLGDQWSEELETALRIIELSP